MIRQSMINAIFVKSFNECLLLFQNLLIVLFLLIMGRQIFIESLELYNKLIYIQIEIFSHKIFLQRTSFYVFRFSFNSELFI